MCVNAATTYVRGQQTFADTRLSRMNRRAGMSKSANMCLFHKYRSVEAETTKHFYFMFVHIDETMQFIYIKSNLVVLGYDFVTTKRHALPQKT